jgi:CheY-like chemotaxis protein
MAKDISPRILVVEDNEGLARVLRLSLRAAGFDTIEVTSGREALDVLERRPPDAAVLDLQLPNGQGGAVLDRLRQPRERTRSSPVWVIISALDHEEAIKRYGPLGDYFLAKPFDPWDLIAMLKNLLAKRGADDPRHQAGPAGQGHRARRPADSRERKRLDRKPASTDRFST